jgi:hypothetical protein
LKSVLPGKDPVRPGFRFVKPDPKTAGRYRNIGDLVRAKLEE